MSEGFTLYAQNRPGRACGTCQLCCTVIPVPGHGLDKPAHTRCRHARFSKGCSIYTRRPAACEYWSCRWLFDEMADGLRRPDRSGYIVDGPDTMLADGKPIDAIQVWLDPARPDAHRAPELRAYLEAIARKYGGPAIIRSGPNAGFLLIAPSISATKDWMEIESAPISEDAMKQKVAAAGGATLATRMQVTMAQD